MIVSKPTAGWSLIVGLLTLSVAALAQESEGASRADESVAAACYRYAETAVRYQMDNLRDQCGLSGGPWHTNYADHDRWCRSVSAERRAEETAQRRAELADCTPAPAENEFCHDYARSGVRQQLDNQRFSCGFSGNPWHSDYLGHLGWCQSVRPARAARETELRGELLAGCR